MAGEVVESTQSSLEFQTVELTPARFSVVVQSSVAEVFVITKTNASFLNEKVQAQMKTVLAKSYEVDCPTELSPREMDRMMKYWQTLRHQLVEEIHSKHYVERHQSEFPFVR